MRNIMVRSLIPMRGTAENIAPNSFDKGDLSVSEWKQYAASASATFDGVTKTVAPWIHITGLPPNQLQW